MKNYILATIILLLLFPFFCKSQKVKAVKKPKLYGPTDSNGYMNSIYDSTITYYWHRVGKYRHIMPSVNIQITAGNGMQQFTRQPITEADMIALTNKYPGSARDVRIWKRWNKALNYDAGFILFFIVSYDVTFFIDFRLAVAMWVAGGIPACCFAVVSSLIASDYYLKAIKTYNKIVEQKNVGLSR